MVCDEATPEESVAPYLKQLGSRVETTVVGADSVENISRLSVCSFRVDTDKPTVMLAIIPVHARRVQLESSGKVFCCLRIRAACNIV